jgi:hypothetical protein
MASGLVAKSPIWKPDDRFGSKRAVSLTSSARQIYLSKRTRRAGGRRFRVGPIPEIIHNFLTTQHPSILCGVNVLRQLLRTGSPRLVLVSLGLGSGGACLNN